MSQTPLLCAHPYPILEDESALLLLSMIERAGLVAEKDLEAMSGVKSPQLQRHCHRLHLGKFIEHGATFIRLTEAGRDMIDRLSLYDEIIEDILDAMGAHGPERRIWEQYLRAYRKSCFPLYQNSMCTMRQWTRLAMLFLPEGGIGQRLNRFVMRLFLARDVRNWRMQLLPHECRADVESSIMESEEPVHRLLWQVLLDKSDLERKLESPLDANAQGVAECVYAFHRLQVTCGPDVWLDVWSEGLSKLLRPADGQRRTDYQAFFKSLHDSDVSQRVSSETHVSNHFSDTWIASNQLAGGFMTHLAAAKNMADLSARVGLSQPSLKPILQEVRQSCVRLLPSRSAEKPHGREFHKRAGATSQQAALWWLLVKSRPRLSLKESWSFIRWLMSSPKHIFEFIHVRHQDERAMRAVDARGVRSNVTHVNWWRGSALSPVDITTKRRVASLCVTAAVLVSMSMLLLLGGTVVETRGWTVETAPDELMTTRQLEDGSVVSIEHSSKLRVDFTGQRRILCLQEGKATFDVAMDKENRPFVVSTVLVDATATASRFAVSVDTGGVEVEVYEGGVTVSPQGEKPGALAITVSNGQVLRMPLDGAAAVVAPGGADLPM